MMTDRKFKKNLSTTCLILFTVVMLLLVYWGVFAPIITRFLINKENYIYQGSELYLQRDYLEFEDGNSFSRVIEYFGVPDEENVIDFYYSDLCVEDNPFYGKQCDVYALDIMLSSDDFQSLKNRVLAANVVSCTISDYTVFAFKDKPTEPGYLVMVAFCDKAHIARYLMITEASPTSYAGFDGYIRNFSNMCWEENSST